MRGIKLSRFNAILACAILICVVLYYGRIIFIPIFYAIFFAMLTRPVSDKLEKWGINRVYSTLISLLIVIIISGSIAGLISIEFKTLSADIPKIEKRSDDLIYATVIFLSETLNITKERAEQVMENLKNDLRFSGNFFNSFTKILTNIFLVIVFMFLFLYQREKYENFLVMLVKSQDREATKALIAKMGKVAHHYLTGRLISVAIFTILFTVGFFIVGIKGAFLLGFVAGLLTIIPYVGSIIGCILLFAVALVTSESTGAAFGAVAVILLVQIFDDYFIEPYIIGGEVHISAFFTILILFIGDVLWGISGMILFIPILGVVKIIFDNIKELTPYGYLVGDQKAGTQSKRMFAWVRKMIK